MASSNHQILKQINKFAYSNQIDELTKLLTNNPSINLNTRITPNDNILHIVARRSDGLEIIKLLVKHGADPNIINEDHNDALFIATFHFTLCPDRDKIKQYHNTIKYLVLDCGADRNARGMKRGNAFINICHRFYDGHNRDIIKETILLFLDSGVDLSNRMTAIHIATVHKQYDIVELIKDYQHVLPETKGCYDPDC